MHLSKREKQVLKMLCLSTEEIAKHLGISIKTAKTYINKLYYKFPLAYNRAGIIFEALKNEIINVNEVMTD